jgi:hypothetical protein
MFVIGIDPNRGSHTAAVLDEAEEPLDECRVVADRRQRQQSPLTQTGFGRAFWRPRVPSRHCAPPGRRRSGRPRHAAPQQWRPQAAIESIVASLLPQLPRHATPGLGAERFAEMPLRAVVRPAGDGEAQLPVGGESAVAVAGPMTNDAELTVYAGADGRWRWRYRDPANDVELDSNTSYLTEQLAEADARQAYPETPLVRSR